MEVVSTSVAQTQALAACLGKIAPPATVIVLEGSLGAGKTSFVQGLARGLNVEAVVNSPTFTIVKEYRGRLPLFHFDLYRVGEDELWELGLEEYFASPGICALEWGSKAGILLPQEHLVVTLESCGVQERLIRLAPRGRRHRQLVEELRARC